MRTVLGIDAETLPDDSWQWYSAVDVTAPRGDEEFTDWLEGRGCPTIDPGGEGADLPDFRGWAREPRHRWRRRQHSATKAQGHMGQLLR